MIELLASMVFEFGRVYSEAKPCKENTEVVCEETLEVIHDVTPARILRLLKTSPSYSGQLFSLYPEANSLEIITPSYCKKIVFSRSRELAVVDLKFLGNAKCSKSRASNAFVSTFNINNGVSTEESVKLAVLVKQIILSPLLVDHNIQVDRINDYFYHLYNVAPEKNIILDGQDYWESISLLVSSEGDLVTLFIDGSWGTGLNPPHEFEYQSIPRHFRTQTQTFYLSLKRHLYG